ncbi:H2A protein, partial [Copsychus sechellarum]|nr:H2A protein [Copsychus sechellarum]
TEAEAKPKPKPKAKARSRSARAGLVFSVGRCERQLRKGNYAERLGSTAAVFMAAVLEYLTAEILELAGNAARHYKKHRVTPRHIQLALRHDEELNKLCNGVIIPGGGVVSGVHPALLPKKTGKKRGKSQ